MKTRNLCLSAFAALLVSGCMTKTYTGETTSTTVDENGVQITKTETRSVLPGNVLAGSETEIREVTADVVAVNRATREVVLKTGATTQTFVAGDAVKNFNQIKPGDHLNLSYFASVNFEVRKPTAEEVARSESPSAYFGRAPRGSKPAGAVGIGDIAIFVVDSVDRTAHTVSLIGQNGSAMVVKAKYPENLQLVKRGDNVVVEVAGLFLANVAPQQS